MRINHRILCLFLMILLCAPMLLTGCADATSSGQTRESEAVTESVSTPLLLIGDGAKPYTIVRPDNADAKEMDAVRLLRSHLQAGGALPTVTTDWKGNPVSEYEIVVGKTKREILDKANEAIQNLIDKYNKLDSTI